MRSSTVKRLGVILVIAGAPLLHAVVPGAFWIRTSAAVAAGLMMIFFSKEPVEDERVQDLKLKAVSAAFAVSFAATLILNWLLNRDFDVTRDFSGATDVYRSISAFDLIILTMVVAIALFHYWRVRDGESLDAPFPAAADDRPSPNAPQDRRGASHGRSEVIDSFCVDRCSNGHGA